MAEIAATIIEFASSAIKTLSKYYATYKKHQLRCKTLKHRLSAVKEWLRIKGELCAGELDSLKEPFTRLRAVVEEMNTFATDLTRATVFEQMLGFPFPFGTKYEDTYVALKDQLDAWEKSCIATFGVVTSAQSTLAARFFDGATALLLLDAVSLVKQRRAASSSSSPVRSTTLDEDARGVDVLLGALQAISLVYKELEASAVHAGAGGTADAPVRRALAQALELERMLRPRGLAPIEDVEAWTPAEPRAIDWRLLRFAAQEDLLSGPDFRMRRAVYGHAKVVVRQLHEDRIETDAEAGTLDATLKSLRLEAKKHAYLGSHPNVVAFWGADIAPTPQAQPALAYAYLVFEDATKTLRAMIHMRAMKEGATRLFDQAEALAYVLDVTSGLAHLHRHRMHHRALSSLTVAVCADNTLKIFNLTKSHLDTRVGGHNPTNNLKSMGTYIWLAPEQLRTKNVMKDWEKIDVYSYGLLIFELATCGAPFENSALTGRKFSGILEIANYISSGGEPDVHDDAKERHGDLLKFAKKCWNANPLQRPSLVDGVIERRFHDKLRLLGGDPRRASRRSSESTSCRFCSRP